MDPSIPHRLEGDPVRIKQILNNLISDAVKFTGEGDVTVKVVKDMAEANRINLSLVVSDTGIGISEKQLDKLFIRFHQLDSSTSRKYGGTGLGLTVVKKLMDMIGGTINVESTVGKGTNITVTVRMNIFTNQLLMTTMLTKKGWGVDITENGIEVLEKIGAHHYDLILMDIQMPEMGGLEATALIRQKERSTGSHIPIIALTANAMKGDEEICIKSSMDDYLSKAIKSDKLYGTLKKYVNA